MKPKVLPVLRAHVGQLVPVTQDEHGLTHGLHCLICAVYGPRCVPVGSYFSKNMFLRQKMTVPIGEGGERWRLMDLKAGRCCPNGYTASCPRSPICFMHQVCKGSSRAASLPCSDSQAWLHSGKKHTCIPRKLAQFSFYYQHLAFSLNLSCCTS